MDIDETKFDAAIKIIFNKFEELCKLLKAKNRLNGETLLDNQDLCLLLNLSKRSLQRYRSLGKLPYVQIGQKTFYLESQVEKFIQECIDKSKDEEAES